MMPVISSRCQAEATSASSSAILSKLVTSNRPTAPVATGNFPAWKEEGMEVAGRQRAAC